MMIMTIFEANFEKFLEFLDSRTQEVNSKTPGWLSNETSLSVLRTRRPFDNVSRVRYNKIIHFFMVAFLTVHKMTKRQPAKKATGAFMAVANRHIYPWVFQKYSSIRSSKIFWAW